MNVYTIRREKKEIDHAVLGTTRVINIDPNGSKYRGKCEILNFHDFLHLCVFPTENRL